MALPAIGMVLVLAHPASAAPDEATALGFHSKAEIRDFQRTHGLKADGIVGPDTRSALRAVPHGRGHTRMAGTARAGARPSAAALPAPAAPGHRLEYLAMFVGGLAILATLAVVKLREPVTYRARVLRDSFRRPPGRPAPGVRWVPGGVFAEGRAARGGIGRFSGSVSAVTELRGERCFLVRDPRRPRGVWVFESEIREIEEPHEIEPPLLSR
jgi:hypothetical protein